MHVAFLLAKKMGERLGQCEILFRTLSTFAAFFSTNHKANMKKLVIYWFRNDLRTEDNPALNFACELAKQTDASLLPVFCHRASYGTLHTHVTQWGFARMSAHRQRFLRQTLDDLRYQFNQVGKELFELDGELSQQSLFWSRLKLAKVKVSIVCEEIAAPEELAEIAGLRDLGYEVHTQWQSTLYDPSVFGAELAQMPNQFTNFRQQIEQSGVLSRDIAISQLNDTLTDDDAYFSAMLAEETLHFEVKGSSFLGDERSSFPYWQGQFQGGSRAGLAHVKTYFSTELTHHYKETRNQLFGIDFSTKFSPWLASGAISASQIVSALRRFESTHGQSKSSYWIWFELLWRDYFRFLHCKYGTQLYRARGLSLDSVANPAFDAERFYRWSQGQTGEPLIDAAMRELRVTGYLSNRLRQQVFSYWLHELAGDWRVGAAWFESQLLDYDVYSNHGNCLYLAGLGTDPRGYSGGRWFDPQKQAKQHDADGSYRRLWSTM